jgi:hypothetical protein
MVQDTKNERLVKVQLNHGEWIPTPFCEIPKGLFFMLSEEDGEPVGTFLALSDPWLNEDGVWTIETKEENENK